MSMLMEQKYSKTGKKNNFKIVMQVHLVFMETQKEFQLKNQMIKIQLTRMLKQN